MYSFRFYDGASVHDVRYALTRGCGHSEGRGNKYRKTYCSYVTVLVSFVYLTSIVELALHS